MAAPEHPPAQTRPSWGGRLFFLPGRMLYVGPGATADRHAHHAIQVVVSFEAPVEVDFGEGLTARRAVVIPADVPHTFRTQTSLLALLFVEPEGPGGRALGRRLQTGAAATAAAETRLLSLPRPSVDGWGAADALGWVARALELLGEPTAVDPVLHPAVRKALTLLGRSLDEVPKIDALARHAGVSGSRLMHLFASEVGLPVRRYVLWLRLKRAAEAVTGGASLTEAAYAGGFADGAHLSRTFRDMFGMSPSLVLPRLEFVGRPWSPT